MASSSGAISTQAATGNGASGGKSTNIASILSSSGGTLQATEMYSLKWNAYESHLTAGLAKLLQDQEFTDVTLACDGQFIQAHKMLLSLCSPYFKRMFQVNKVQPNNANTIVILNNVEFHNLESIIQFIYNGEVNVRNVDFENFLRTGEMLQIEGLSGASAKSQGDSTDNKCVRQPQPLRKPTLSAAGPSMSIRTTVRSDTPTQSRAKLDSSPAASSHVRTFKASELPHRNASISPRNSARAVVLLDETDPLEVVSTSPGQTVEDTDPLHLNGMEVFETGNSGDSFESLDQKPLSAGYQTYENRNSELLYDDHGSNQDDTFEEYIEMTESEGLLGPSGSPQQRNTSRQEYRQRVDLEYTTSPYRVPEQRRKSSALWDYFLYDKDLDLVQCQLTRSGRPCHFHARHKPLSNMKYHIRTCHPREYEIILPRLLNRN